MKKKAKKKPYVTVTFHGYTPEQIRLVRILIQTVVKKVEELSYAKKKKTKRK